MQAHPIQASGALAALLFAGAASNAVWAACTPGSQCRVDDGSTQIRANEQFQAVSTNTENAALVVTNNSTLNGVNLSASAPATGEYGAYADAGGALNLTGTNITGWAGLYANGAGSTVVMTGGAIHASDAANVGTGAVAVRQGADVTLNDVAVSSDSVAVRVENSGSSLVMTGGSIDAVSGGLTYNGGSGSVDVTLDDVDITAQGGYGIAGVAGNNTLTINGGAIRNLSAVQGSSSGVNVGGGVTRIRDALIKSGDVALRTFGSVDLADVEAANVHFHTRHANGTGVLINQNAIARLEGGSIVTEGGNAAGISVVPDASAQAQAAPLTVIGVTMETSGDDAQGVEIQGGTANLVNTDITVKGNVNTLTGRGTAGLYAAGGNATTYKPVIHMTGGSIATQGLGVRGAAATTNAEIHLDGVDIVTANATSEGVLSFNNAVVSLRNSTIHSMGHGVRVQSQASAVIENSSIVTTGANKYGVWASSQAQANLSGSAITATGADSIGLFFQGATAPNSMDLDNSSVQAVQSFAVAASGGANTLNVNASTLAGDRLAFAGNLEQGGQTFGSTLNVNAQSSQLFGHVQLAEASRLNLVLDDSAWTLRPSSEGTVRSDVSTLTMRGDTLIQFDAMGDPMQTGNWQTLGVGFINPASSTVYQAGSGANVTMNTWLNPGGALANQFTDRLLINGDVVGQTVVHVVPAAGSPGGLTSPGGGLNADEGISLIQAAGQAAPEAFSLFGGYVTLNDQPYQYRLVSYGPGAEDGLAEPAQRLVNGTDPHWDWRLQSVQVSVGDPVDPDDPFKDDPGATTPEVAPQVANYLLAPTALFEAGMQDIGALHRRLGDVRMGEASGSDRGEAFLRAYGANAAYRSDRSRAQYGYAADIRYAAVQAGGSLYRSDAAQGRTRIGVAASTGDLSFDPGGVDASRKTRVDVWSVSPFLTWQHASGGYVDVIASLGKFTGKVSTTVRGNTARLSGRRSAASIEAGLPVDLGAGGVTVVPQAQLVHQHLKFDRTRDAGDGFPVEIGTHRRWTLRVGAQVRKALETAAPDNHAQLYGSVHVLKHVDKGQQVWLGDAFTTGRSGAALEVGLGANASLARGKTQLYGEVKRQQRIGGHGSSGWTFNLGVRVKF